MALACTSAPASPRLVPAASQRNLAAFTTKAAPLILRNRSSHSICSHLPQRRLILAHRRLARTAAAAATDVDHDAGLMELDIKVEGMVCDGCSSRVAETLKKEEGVHEVSVDLKSGIATVIVAAEDQFAAATVALPQLIAAVEGLGFGAEPHFEQ